MPTWRKSRYRTGLMRVSHPTLSLFPRPSLKLVSSES